MYLYSIYLGRGSHIVALGPKYILYRHMNPQGLRDASGWWMVNVANDMDLHVHLATSPDGGTLRKLKKGRRRTPETVTRSSEAFTCVRPRPLRVVRLLAGRFRFRV